MAVALLLFACGGSSPLPSAVPFPGQPTPAALPAFDDVTSQSGIAVVNLCGTPAKQYIIEVNGAGACWLDFDRDGVLDLYVVNGSTYERYTSARPGEPNRLFRGRGDGRFEEVADAAGAANQEGRAWGYGCSVSDYDGDGWPDLLATNLGRSRLYRNLGGNFADVSDSVGITREDWSTGAAFADLDGDGHLDLFVTNYLTFNFASPPVDGKEIGGIQLSCKWRGSPVMCGPLDLPAEQDRFYRATGDGRFEDQSVSAGLGAVPPGFGFSAVAVDFDDDGDLDVYVANDSVANHLWQNDGSARFSEVALRSGVAMDETGAPQASMGLDAQDYDGDGRIDLLYTNFAKQYTALLRNLGSGVFNDVSWMSGIGTPSLERLKWGTAFVDFDNDRDLDVFVVNGHVYPDAGNEGEGGFRQRNQLFENLGTGKFADVSDGAGAALQPKRVGRGLAVADFDQDGGLDFVVTNLDEKLTVLRNVAIRGHWLVVDLVGVASNREGFGSRVTAKVAGRELVRDHHNGGSYLSGHMSRIHFGLGDSAVVDELVVRWQSGAETRIQGVAGDRLVTLREGDSEVRPGPIRVGS